MDNDDEKQMTKHPPIFRVALRMLKEAMRQLTSGECDEDEVVDVIDKLSPNNKGYKREEDYVTIDKGMEILGMGQNRVGFCKLMKENGIVNEKFNTIHIGYNRQKILALKHKTEEEYQKRLEKQKRNRKIKKNLDY